MFEISIWIMIVGACRQINRYQLDDHRKYLETKEKCPEWLLMRYGKQVQHVRGTDIMSSHRRYCCLWSSDGWNLLLPIGKRANGRVTMSDS